MKQDTYPGKESRRCSAIRSSLASFTLLSRLFFIIVMLTVALGLTAYQANAGFLGHNGLGDFGLQSGTQPDPGLLLSFMYIKYDSDTLRDKDGDIISLDPSDPGSIDVNGFAAGVWYVTNVKLIGANYGFMIFPGFTSNQLEAPALGLVQETEFGLTDLYIQPINLGWHIPRADFIVGFGLYAPIGRYDPDASDNLGMGMWSFEFSGGTTIYFDRARTWHFATTAFYEIHSKKKDTDIRVGDILTLEGGFGKSFLEGAMMVGAAYYAQWKVTADELGQDAEELLAEYEIGKHSGFGLGPEVTFPIVTKKKLIALITGRFFWETGVRSNLEGTTFVLNAAFPIPSVPLQ